MYQNSNAVRWRIAVHAIVFASIFAGCLLPWMIRQQMLFERFALTEFVGRNLWVVTFQDQAGAGLALPSTMDREILNAKLGSLLDSDDWRLTWRVSDRLVESGLNDAQADRWMRQVAIDAIREHPIRFAGRAMKRTVNFWRSPPAFLPGPTEDKSKLDGQFRWSWPFAWIEVWLQHAWSRSINLNTCLAIIVAIANAVLIFDSRTRVLGVWCGCGLMYFAVLTGLLEIPDYRYRSVVEPWMALVVAAAVCRGTKSEGLSDVQA